MSDKSDFENVEIPSQVVEQVRKNCEEYGFPTAEGFIEYAIKYLLAEDPEASEEHIQDLLESRRQVNRGETYSMEEVMEEISTE